MYYNLLKHIIYIINLYIVFSISEWCIHKYIMHSNNENNYISKAHSNHHKDTNNDCTLRSTNIHSEKIDKYQGLFFIWQDTLTVFILGYVLALFLNIKFNLHYSFVFIYTLLFTIYQSTLWNTIHPEIHQINYTPSIREACPRLLLLRNLPYYNWLKENHEKHHKFKNEKKGNFNITLPFADFLFNTYN